jgi:hypothetical protein
MELMSERWTDERLDEFRSEVTGRFDEVDHRFVEVDRRFDKVDRRFADVDHRFDKVEQRFGHLDEKFVWLNQRLDGVEGALQNQSAEWRVEIKAVRVEIKAGFDGLHRLMIQAGVVLGAALIGMVGAVLVVAIV